MHSTTHHSDLARPVRSANTIADTPGSPHRGRARRRQAGSILAALAVLVFSLASVGIASSAPAGADDYTSYPSKPANGSCALQLSPLETRCSVEADVDAFSPLVFTVNDIVFSSTHIGGEVTNVKLPATCAPVVVRYVIDGIELTETVAVAVPAIAPSPCTGGPIPTVTTVPVVTATAVPVVTATPVVVTPTPKAKVTVVATATPKAKAKATVAPTATATAKKNPALAYTGSDNGPLVFAGMALIAAGGVALTVRRMTHRDADER